MSAPLWIQNLLAYSLQVALLAAAGLLLPRVVRLRRARVLYRYWQALLAACLLLPFIQPWRPFETARSTTAASRILFDSEAAVTRLATLPAARLILLALAGGVVVRLMWLALGLAELRRYRSSARRLEFLPPGIQQIATRLGVAPGFCLSEEVAGPVTFGLRRPIILLPPCFRDMDADRQRVIASHELLHVVRRDWVMNLGEEIILSALWFHPVVWWLVGRIRLSREQVVDQQVVELTGARKPYLYALVEIAAGPAAARALAAPAFLHEGQLAERIRSLVREDFMSKRRIIISLVCVVVLTLVAVVAIIRKFPLRAGAPVRTASNAVQPASGIGDIFRVGNGVTAPEAIYKPEPGYTQEARAAKLQGTTVLSIVVARDGTVSDVKVIKPLGQGLAESAVETVKTWKFKPAMKEGQPVACRVSVEVSFRFY